MKERSKKIVLYFIGVFFISFGIFAMWNSFNIGVPSGVLWFCYSSLILIGIGMIIRNGFLIGSQLNILLIPLILWTLDFLSLLLFEHSLFGIADYFFRAELFSLSSLVSLEHLFLLPLALIGLWITKYNREDFWKFSLVQVVVFYFATRLFTDPINNVNCVFSPCFDFIGNTAYPFIWFTGFATNIFISYLIITNLKIFKGQKPKNENK